MGEKKLTVRESMEELEEQYLSPYASLSRNTLGRDKPEPRTEHDKPEKDPSGRDKKNFRQGKRRRKKTGENQGISLREKASSNPSV